ncbi:MAG: hypothetical protein L7U72_17095 [Rubripirellula sp.]|nr:hypothetical protein [Rubripirellula sp.]
MSGAVSSFLLLGPQSVRAEWSYTVDFESNMADGTAPADGQIENAGYTSSGYVTARIWTSFATTGGDNLTHLQNKFPLGVNTTEPHNHWVLRSSEGPDLHEAGDGYLEFASRYQSQAGNWVAGIFR